MARQSAPGRPYGIGLDVMVHARFTPELADKLVGLARAWGLSLSEAIRRLVEAAEPESGAER